MFEGILFNGDYYNDDRMYILEATLVQTGNNKEKTWAVITRRNTHRYPPTRIDHFPRLGKALEFIKEVEPTTPRISLNGQEPKPTPSHEEHLKWLQSIGAEIWNKT